MADYIALQWRKALERKGWRKFAGPLPRRMIEYHIIRNGRLYSGRCEGQRPMGNMSDIGSQANVIQRRDLIDMGVWRLALRPGGEHGQTVRPAPF